MSLDNACLEEDQEIVLLEPHQIGNKNVRDIVVASIELKEKRKTNPDYRVGNYSEAYQGET